MLLIIISTILILLSAIMAAYIVFFLVVPMIRGAVYVPSPWDRVYIMLDLLDIKPGDRAIDVGSGDGRLVIEMAKKGAVAQGIEINPLLVMWSNYKIKKAGLGHLAKIQWKNQWRQNFEEFDKVSVYGIPYIMSELEEKLRKELKPGSLVVSNAFPFPTWKPIKEENGNSEGAVRLYVKED